MTHTECQNTCMNHEKDIAMLKEKTGNLEKYIKSISERLDKQFDSIKSILNYFIFIAISSLGGIIALFIQNMIKG